jgi:hypothetical protein
MGKIMGKMIICKLYKTLLCFFTYLILDSIRSLKIRAQRSLGNTCKYSTEFADPKLRTFKSGLRIAVTGYIYNVSAFSILNGVTICLDRDSMV